MTDEQARFLIYDITMREGAPPAKARLGADAVAAMKRLAAARMLVLQPDTDEILMAGPFSAVPTPFRVTLDAFSCYGNCIWDALGIAATLQKDAEIDTSCADCGTAARVSIKAGNVIGDGFMHFALPPRMWWQDIVFT
ncbi:MAG: organomercurial lyase [Thermoanaerobaculia bacterium]